MMWGYTNSWWGWLLMVVGMVGFWGLLIAVVVVLLRGPGQSRGSDPGRRPDPEEVLAERFARGEIDADEYHQRLQVLRGRRADRVAEVGVALKEAQPGDLVGPRAGVAQDVEFVADVDHVDQQSAVLGRSRCVAAARTPPLERGPAGR
jgi:putative membrane protein